MNPNAYRRECVGFLDFLKSQGIGISEDTTKEKLRDVYNRQYKPSVNFRLPSFSQMLFNMKRLGLVRVKDGEYVHFLNKDRTRRKSKTNVANKSPLVNQDNNNSKGATSDKRIRTPRSLVSVDQHVALRVRSQMIMNGTMPSTSARPSIPNAENPYSCPLCKVACNSEDQLMNHRAGQRHKLNCLKFKFNLKKIHLVKDKGGVIISAVNVTSFSPEDGIVDVALQESEVKRFNFEVKNEGKGPVELLGCVVIKYLPSCTLDDHQGVSLGIRTVQIAEGDTYVILATCNGRLVGYESIPILFQLKRGNNFQILRTVHIITDTSLTESLRPIAPFKPPPRAAINPAVPSFEPGLPLDKAHHQDELEKLVELKFYNVPSTVRTINNHGVKPFAGMTLAQETLLRTMLKDFQCKLTSDNYCSRFRNLLYLEEIQMEVDIRRYDMSDVSMSNIKGQDHLLQLEVPGLAENRPSLIRGDKVYGKTSSEQLEYEGIVHLVRQKDVYLGFSERLRERFIEGMKFDVRFTVNRLPTRVQQRAIDLAHGLSLWGMLFPAWQAPPADSAHILESKFVFRNRNIEDNVEQQQAVRSIVAGTSGLAPYIIYGPPGTGKTVTLVEAIKQVLHFHPNAHVLACAPTNSAADLIAEKLIENDHVQMRKILRVHALTRNFETVSPKVKDISNFKNGKYFFPKKEKISQYQVLVITLLSAGRLVSAHFPRNHFTHVFIDECGQAVEPEAIVPIAGILESRPSGSHGQVVLVGDPKQLGPILRSPIAIKYGLGMSILERLMQTPIYQRQPKSDSSGGTYNSHIITKLVRNYRSHPSILTVPNELFYDDELQAFADELARSQLCQWEGLPCQNFPIIFHGVVGKDEQEARSPSFFNRSEINVVVNYVKDLLGSRKVNVKPEDIGIIAPYNRQVQKIRRALEILGQTKMKEMKDQDPTKISVGSTEQFQGQERKVIIISCVRSNPDLLNIDYAFKLGFLKNPKRFNVAVTRAKALLILVGNPHILCLDLNWNKYLDYCVKKKAYVGCSYCPTDSGDELVKKLNDLQLGDDAEASLNNLLTTSNLNAEEPPWRTDI